MKTAFEVKEGTLLYIKGQVLIEAAYSYWEEMQKIHGAKAVIWLTDTDGKTVFFTRGEQAEHLKTCIEPY